MEIIVEGIGRGIYKPDEINLNLKFIYKSNIYSEVLEYGKKQVLEFVDKVLLKYGFKIDDMKTRSFIIKEEKKYNDDLRIYEFDGYSFNQETFLKFDYDDGKLFNMMKDISLLDNPPYYIINFGIKDENGVKNDLISKAYKDALEKANVIASVSGKELKRCSKVSFKPLNIDFLSLSSLNSDATYLREGAIHSFDNTFTPEDIDLSNTIYCLWIAE